MHLNSPVMFITQCCDRNYIVIFLVDGRKYDS